MTTTATTTTVATIAGCARIDPHDGHVVSFEAAVQQPSLPPTPLGTAAGLSAAEGPRPASEEVRPRSSSHSRSPSPPSPVVARTPATPPTPSALHVHHHVYGLLFLKMNEVGMLSLLRNALRWRGVHLLANWCLCSF